MEAGLSLPPRGDWVSQLILNGPGSTPPSVSRPRLYQHSAPNGECAPDGMGKHGTGGTVGGERLHGHIASDCGISIYFSPISVSASDDPNAVATRIIHR